MEKKKLYTQDELPGDNDGFLSDFLAEQTVQEDETFDNNDADFDVVNDDAEKGIFEINKTVSTDTIIESQTQSKGKFPKEKTDKPFVKSDKSDKSKFGKKSSKPSNKGIDIQKGVWREVKNDETYTSKIVSPNQKIEPTKKVDSQENKGRDFKPSNFPNRTYNSSHKPRAAHGSGTDTKESQVQGNRPKFTPNKPQTQEKRPFKQGKPPFKQGGNNQSNNKFQGNRQNNTSVRQSPPSSSNVTKKDKIQAEAKTSSTLKKKTLVTIGEKITIKEFSEKMGVNLGEVMKKLLKNKIILPATASIDYDTACLIGVEFDVEVKKTELDVSVDDIISGNLQVILNQDKFSENLVERPPIVTIMGHVDHGKTTLLDYIRQTSIVNSESGGITQSIGGSQVIHSGKKITFIDTPGHELFTSLRARGAKITDIVVIVIAADDGVKQQTIEAINHAKDSGVPIIVAITKIDKPSSNMDIIKSQLAEYELIPEEWGGDIPIVKLSAVTGEGVDELMENILLQSDILELKYNPDRLGVGVVLEANKDTKKGVTTSLILMSGKMSLGDVVLIHNTYGKVRKMVNWQGEDIKVAYAGDPIMILGIQSLPEPGRVTEVMKTEKEASAKVSLIKSKEQKGESLGGLQSMLEKISQGESVVLKLILKGDSFGSLEALKYSISKVELPENIEIKVVHADVGSITDSDLILAQASDSVVIGFGVPYTNAMKKSAEQKNVVMVNFSIIYEILDYVDRLAKGLVKVEEKEVIIGKLKVLGVFFKKGKEIIMGGKVIQGKVLNGSLFRTYRGDELVGGGRIMSLKREQDNVNEVNEGYECGMKVKVDKKIEQDDLLEFFVME